MITVDLASFKRVRFSYSLFHQEVQLYREQVQSYFENFTMTAAHGTVLETLGELIKNSIDADAETLFIDDKSSGKGFICVFDDGHGFDKEFLGDEVSLDYGVKLAGFSALNSSKIGQSKLGGSGRGLAEAYEVIKKYQGTLICSNRTDGHKGSFLEFHSSAVPVLASDIRHSFNEQRQVYSSRYCSFDTKEESEKTVSALLQNLSFLHQNRKRKSGQVTVNSTAGPSISF